MDDESTQPLRPAGSADEPRRPTTPPDAPGTVAGNVSPAPDAPRYRTPAGAPAEGHVPPPPPPPGQAGQTGYGTPPPPAGYAGQTGYGTPPPRRYPAPIGWVIAAIILFWPTAIPALLASHRAAAAGGAGDVVTADREAATAKRWSIVSVCVGGGLIVLSILFSILWAILVATSLHNERGGGFELKPGPGQQMPYNRHGMPFNPRRGGVVPKPAPSPTATP